MPELPDLLYIQKYLHSTIQERTITHAVVRQPVVIRNAAHRPIEELLKGRVVESVGIHGPFLRCALSGDIDTVLNLMLMGRLQHQRPGEKPEPYLCVSLDFDDATRLNLCDQQKMAKVYLVRRGNYGVIPNYDKQGVDILSPSFTFEVFRHLAARSARKQVRVFINDHTALSSIGNAYADEILFDAGIHPKTFVGKLSTADLERLFNSIHTVILEGIKHVEAAKQPIHVKVRDHMKVRMRRGEPCPRCGTTIRREGVRGYDVFFCPVCQPASRRLFLDWKDA